MNKVKEFQVETIVETLCNNMLSDKEQLRDISSIGKDYSSTGVFSKWFQVGYDSTENKTFGVIIYKSSGSDVPLVDVKDFT